MPEYKDVTYLKKQIADCKKAIQSSNSDYLTGYVCALSATEGVIAELPDADVVEVVRCMHCKWFKTNTDKENYCDRHSAVWYKFYIRPDDFCSYGERKSD